MKLFYTEKDTDDYAKPIDKDWQFIGNIHAKTHGHIKIDYAKNHGLAIARIL